MTFDIDANGILHVGAKDLGTGKEQKITITASSGLSKDEVEKMRRDAEAHADDDKAKLEEIQTRNEADNAVYRTEKLIKDNADKISGDDKAKLESAVERGEGSAQRLGRRRHQVGEREIGRNCPDRRRGTLQGRGGEGAGGKSQTAAGEPKAEEAKSDDKKKDEGVIDAEVVDEKK